MRGQRCWQLLLAMALGLTLEACGGGDSTRTIFQRWKRDTTEDAAPPGVGSDGRVVIATRSGQGEIATYNEENGVRIEGPFMPVFPTEHAPVVTANTIVIVSSIGKLVGLDFAGQTRFSKPDAPLGLTGPLALAGDGTMRIATTSGRVLGFAADGSTLFDTPIGGAAVSAPAIASDGTTYVATDTGRLVGVDTAGAVTLDVTVNAPASGPSVDGTRVAVGEIDGVRVFNGTTEAFKHPRAARVVGTRFVGGELIAWGEDGIVERLDASGAVMMTYNAGPPIYAPVFALDNDELAIFDSAGSAHLVNGDGAVINKLELGGTPLTEIARGRRLLIASVGRSVRAFDFAFE
jgi:hypothetical protein